MKFSTVALLCTLAFCSVAAADPPQYVLDKQGEASNLWTEAYADLSAAVEVSDDYLPNKAAALEEKGIADGLPHDSTSYDYAVSLYNTALGNVTTAENHYVESKANITDGESYMSAGNATLTAENWTLAYEKFCCAKASFEGASVLLDNALDQWCFAASRFGQAEDAWYESWYEYE